MRIRSVLRPAVVMHEQKTGAIKNKNSTKLNICWVTETKDGAYNASEIWQENFDGFATKKNIATYLGANRAACTLTSENILKTY